MMRRSGFSFIELIAALTAALVLMASLLAIITISTTLIQPDPIAEQRGADQEIQDRIASDLRFATSFDSSIVSGFGINRPSVFTGTGESVTYQSYMDGLTRQVNSQSPVQLDASTASLSFDVDGTTGASAPWSTTTPILRDSRFHSSSGSVTSLSLDLPPSIQHGDLLILAVAFRYATTLNLSDSNWLIERGGYIGDLRLAVYRQIYNASTAQSVTVDFGAFYAETNLAILVIESAHALSPIASSGIRGDTAYASTPSTHPTALSASSIQSNELDLQIIASLESPFWNATLGLPGHTDVLHSLAGSTTWRECSLAIAARSGSAADTTITPRVWFRETATWAQVGLRISGAGL